MAEVCFADADTGDAAIRTCFNAEDTEACCEKVGIKLDPS